MSSTTFPSDEAAATGRTATDELVASARAHEVEFPGPRNVVPARHIAIVTCMDSRIDIFAALGLEIGEAHIIRNAGGLVTDDVLRSLVISQSVLETREIVLIHHTNCGLHRADEAKLAAQIRDRAGADPPYAFGAFADLDDAVRAAIVRVREHRFLPHREHVRGFVYDVTNGHLREVV
jgi:carbonic anhydrase